MAQKWICIGCKKEIDVHPMDNTCPHCNLSFKAIMPQDGPQELFMSMSNVDVVGYGGAAGGGKTWSLLMEPTLNLNDPGWGAVLFRREAKQLSIEGGLWDKSHDVYPIFGGVPTKTPCFAWTFPGGQKFSMYHLSEEDDKYAHQGGEYPWLGFDELTHFTETQFWYLVSRNRSTCGVKPRIRAGFNPDAGSWVKKMFAPWVDDAYADPAESGEVRWLVKTDDGYNYFRTKVLAMAYSKEVNKLPDEIIQHTVKSVSFVEADIYDNKILLESDPGYMANLLAQGEVEKQRLLYKNWNILSARFFMDWMPKTADGKPWNVIPAGPLPGAASYYLCTDWGFSSPWALYLVAILTDGRVIVCREVYGVHRRTSEQGKDMLELLETYNLDTTTTNYAGHDVFNRRLNSKGEYDEPIVHTWWEQGLNVVMAGRDPLNRASKMREYIADWGPDEGWPDGRPGLQVMDCCTNFIRTLPLLKSDKDNTELVDTTQEDHPYDAVGHLITSLPGRPEAKQVRPDIPPRQEGLDDDDFKEERNYQVDDGNW